MYDNEYPYSKVVNFQLLHLIPSYGTNSTNEKEFVKWNVVCFAEYAEAPQKAWRDKLTRCPGDWETRGH